MIYIVQSDFCLIVFYNLSIISEEYFSRNLISNAEDFEKAKPSIEQKHNIN